MPEETKPVDAPVEAPKPFAPPKPDPKPVDERKPFAPTNQQATNPNANQLAPHSPSLVGTSRKDHAGNEIKHN